MFLLLFLFLEQRTLFKELYNSQRLKEYEIIKTGSFYKLYKKLYYALLIM